MFIFESAIGELFFYIFAMFWIAEMPKRSILMGIFAYGGTQTMLLADTLLFWSMLMAFMTLTYKKFGLYFLIGFGLGSGKIQDWLNRRVL